MISRVRENSETSRLDQWEIFRILKWRYVRTIFLAIFSGDIP